ncbi:MAG: LptA/OstA family protein [Armatimonadota bacterium]
MKDNRRAIGMGAVGLGFALAALVLVGQAFSANPVRQKLNFLSGSAKFDSEASTATLTDVKEIVYTAEQRAVMKCSSAVIEFGPKNQAQKVTMQGPVEVDMTTKGENPKHITAKCVKTATYVDETDMITLSGSAECTVRQPQSDAQASEFTVTGERLTLHLKTGDFAVEGGQGRPAAGVVTLPEKKEEEPKEEDAGEKEQGE